MAAPTWGLTWVSEPAARAGAGDAWAALVLTVPATAQRKEDKTFVVCLEDGVPAIDVLANEADARNALGGEDRPIWSDNPVAYPNCEPADFAWLAAGGDRLARLQPMPINPWHRDGRWRRLPRVRAGHQNRS